MVTLSPSGLVEINTGATNWVTTFNTNLVLLNNTLLKISALGDVNVAGLANGDTLRYDSASGTWKPWHPDINPI